MKHLFGKSASRFRGIFGAMAAAPSRISRWYGPQSNVSRPHGRDHSP